LVLSQVTTIRLRFLKIGAVILRNSRRIRFPLSISDPEKTLFVDAAATLTPG
jgi:hypothetical protein